MHRDSHTQHLVEYLVSGQYARLQGQSLIRQDRREVRK